MNNDLKDTMKELIFTPKEKLIKMILSLVKEKKILIKYLEDKIEKSKNECASLGHLVDKETKQKYDLVIKAYQDILERLKSGKYE